jgi:hypothetical protein
MELRGFAAFCALCTLALGSGGCLLFTDKFNKPPAVKIAGPESLFRGETRQFTASIDDDEDGSAFEWVVSDGSCPASLAEALAARRSSRFFGDRDSFELPKRDKAGPTCVFVIATDRAGAQGFAGKPVTVKDRMLVIHRPPRIERGQPATFAAAFLTEAGDADDVETTRRSSFAWARDRLCDAAETTAGTAGTQKAISTWTVDAAPRHEFCVAVRALDENGIAASATIKIADVINTGPSATIRMLQPEQPALPLGLFTNVRVSGADAGDVDPADAGNYAWVLTRPGGVATMATGPELAFATETAGKYRIDLTITEDGKTAMAQPLALDVADAAPCIRTTEPSYLPVPRFVTFYDQPRSFRVIEVTDDADPVPATSHANLGAFVWSTRLLSDEQTTAPDFQVRAGSFPELVLPARLYQPGDRVEVRVEYLDRLDLIQARDLSHCKPNEPHCELVAGSKCYQRITWTVIYL